MGKVLQERRETLGIPRAELARRIGVSASYVWLIEQAKKRESGKLSQPSEELLRQWAKVLGWEAVYTNQLLALAGHITEDNPSKPKSRISLPFSGVGMLHFPQPKGMEEEVLIQKIRELLRKAEASEEKWEEVVELLTSFLDWLEFHTHNPV